MNDHSTKLPSHGGVPIACNRREALSALGSLAAGASTGLGAEIRPRRVAVLMTAFFYRSHAHVILENFLVPYLFNGRVVDPREEFPVASFYVDQFPQNRDMARDTARRFGIPIFNSISKALCRGGTTLDVDAVLMICEHGTYPFNDKGQELYPKKKFYDEMVSVFRSSRRSVPVYCDKHLSHRWDEALEMVTTARKMQFGLMAGSSVPLAQRVPDMEIPSDARIESAVSVHGGPMERYGFHGLEVLQAMVEGRRGGESGIRQVRCVEGDDFWREVDRRDWLDQLTRAAMEAELGMPCDSLRALVSERFREAVPHAFLIDYADGLRGAVVKIGQSGIRWNFACRLAGEPAPRAVRFDPGPWQNRNLFKALAHAIQWHFRHGRPPYPVERTLLTSGALEAAIDSHVAGGTVRPTPHLVRPYQPMDYSAFRERGASWKIIREETPQPRGIEPVGVAVGPASRAGPERNKPWHKSQG